MTPQEAIARAATLLERAERLAGRSLESSHSSAQALTWIADSWVRLAEALDDHPRMAPDNPIADAGDDSPATS